MSRRAYAWWLAGIATAPYAITAFCYAFAWIWTLIGNRSQSRVTQDMQFWLARDFFTGGWNLLEATWWWWLITAIQAGGIIAVLVTGQVMTHHDREANYSNNLYRHEEDRRRREYDRQYANSTQVVPEPTKPPKRWWGNAPRWRWAVVSAMVLVLLLSFSPGLGRFWTGTNDSGKTWGQEMNAATRFLFHDPAHAPSSAGRLLEGAHADPTGRCLLVGKHDVPSCIVQGDYTKRFDPRVASASGALTRMQKTGGSDQGSYIMGGSLTYLHDTKLSEQGEPTGRWTSIRDGKEAQRISSSVSYSGGRVAPECAFNGKYSLKFAFDGTYTNGFRNHLAYTYPQVKFDDTDVWTDCISHGSEQAEPVLYIVGYQQYGERQRSFVKPGPLLEIHGSPDGDPVITEHWNVKPGQFNGPVYPIAVLKQQREALTWAAGEKWHNRGNYGYVPLDEPSQMGNVSEYLLRDENGRLCLVTPLKYRGTDNTNVAGYAVAYADEMNAGQLNQLDVYIFDDGDASKVAYDQMDQDIQTWLSQKNVLLMLRPEADIVEFTPTNGPRHFRAFGVYKGLPVFRFDITVTDKKTTEVQAVIINENGTTAPLGNCGRAPEELSLKENSDCAKTFTDYLNQQLSTLADQQNNSGTPSPQPSGTPVPSTSPTK